MTPSAAQKPSTAQKRSTTQKTSTVRKPSAKIPAEPKTDPGGRPADHVIVLFGATGDLAKRKLIPGLFHLAVTGLMPEHYRIVGVSPSNGAPDVAGFKKHAKDAVSQFGSDKPSGEKWKAFEKNLSFAAVDSDPAPLQKAVSDAKEQVGPGAHLLFHLAIPPVAFGSVIDLIGASGLSDGARVIIEKPFGTDYQSARALNQRVHKVFDESQIFRIDHFVGKESVDNILALRFANGLFEPIWNREHIEYVQVDVPETLTIEGRADFYEGTGAFRDMVVTHLFQVLGFVGMEPPTSISAKGIRSEKQKVFDSMLPLDVKNVVRGQYDGYLSEPGVAKGSTTETFVALRAYIENWRWSGVPFHLRTGKAMGASRQVVTIGFREPILRMFPVNARLDASCRHNELNIDFGDPGSITARFLAKEPGRSMRLGPAKMVFQYANFFNISDELEGYEHLILEAMLGDQSFFTSADQVERLWEISTPLLQKPPKPEPYAKGSWGPASIEKVVSPHHWYLPETEDEDSR